MSDFMKQLSSYNLFNNLLPGVVFCVLVSQLFPISLIQEDIITGVFFYYFVGLVIGRIGSIVIEPLLKKTKIISFSSYSEYLSASKSDPKIEVLSETNNMYRAILSMTLAMALTALHFYLSEAYDSYLFYSKYIFITGLLILFGWSYRKQTQYVKSRIENSKGSREK